jgi:hypothetical protein
LAAVRRLNRLEFIGETLRACLEALSAASAQWLVSWMDPAWQKRYGARTDAYRLPSERSERDRLAQQIGSCPAGWCSHGSCFGSGCGVICGSGSVGLVVKSSAMEPSER